MHIFTFAYQSAGFDMIEGEEYLGATGLHLAIAYGNDEVAEMLILSETVYFLILRILKITYFQIVGCQSVSGLEESSSFQLTSSLTGCKILNFY